jgi:hypothetical protein
MIDYSLIIIELINKNMNKLFYALIEANIELIVKSKIYLINGIE